jgi:hypothetical protein
MTDPSGRMESLPFQSVGAREDQNLIRIGKLLAHLAARASGYRAFEGLERDVIQLALQSFGSEMSSLEDYLKNWVRSVVAGEGATLTSDQKKQLSRVEWRVSGPFLVLSASQMSQLRSWLVQILRNFVAHGLTPQPGYELRPWFSLSWRILPGGIELLVEDSGPGLEWAGPPSLNESRELLTKIENEVFAPGVSQVDSPDEWAGNGMGLSFLREEARKLGGDVNLVLPIEGAEGGRVVGVSKGRLPFCLRVTFVPDGWIGFGTKIDLPEESHIKVHGHPHSEVGIPYLFLPWDPRSEEKKWVTLWGDPPVLIHATWGESKPGN